MNKNEILQIENHLQRISRRFISIENDLNRAFRQHFDNVSIDMIRRIKEKDAFFGKIFQMIQLAGSYADGIKVSAPNEFDVLVLLKFPKPVPVSSLPGYVTINISDGLNTWFGWMNGNDEKYKRFIDSEGYVIQDQILDWLRVLVREILSEQQNILKINGAEYSIDHYNSGPAITLDVDVRKSPFGGIGCFSIDLVPACQFQSADKWVADKRPTLTVPRFWNAIPKPNKSRLHKNRDWICSYAELERDYLNGLNRMKPLIKFFKKIRDKAELTNLKSYYIKTIFLHKRIETSECYWNTSLALLFMEMFDIILEHLRSKALWSLWHRNYNLFSQLDNYQLNDIYNKLKRIQQKIVRNLANGRPEIIYEEILTKVEMEAMEQKEKVEEESRRWCTIL